MKRNSKAIAVLLAMLMLQSVFAVAAYAASPVFTVNAVSGITDSDAKISAKITNPNKTVMTECGFLFGTSPAKLTIKKYDTLAKVTWNYVEASYLMSKYSVKLTPNTTYYYQFYLITGGKTYSGPVKSFKTTPVVVNTYKPVSSLGVRRIVQPHTDTTGSCYLASIASVYAYGKGTYDGVNYKVGGADIAQTQSKIYQEFYKKNNGTWVTDATITAYGMKKQAFSLPNVYAALKAGKPVAIFNGVHASVIVGYKGNSGTLSTADFIVMEIKKEWSSKSSRYLWTNSTSEFNAYANKPQASGELKSCYVTLSSWISYMNNRTPMYMVTY